LDTPSYVYLYRLHRLFETSNKIVGSEIHQTGIAVKLWNCIQEIPKSNLGCVIGCT